jgi:Telomere regulation protein Stn1
MDTKEFDNDNVVDNNNIREHSGKESNATLTGMEPFLVGLSPSFWAHAPMEINSIVVVGASSQDSRATTGKVRPTTNGGVLVYHGRPVSKCKLVGWIVSADHKGECHYYVVDDGTGLMDVLHFTEDEEALPPLLWPSEDAAAAVVHPHHYNVGDVVSIFGKIIYMDGKVEIRASTMIAATPNDEIRHWQTTCHHSYSQQLLLSRPLDVIAQLGSGIGDQIRDLANLPATDDSIGLWRLFGTSCPCIAGRIKDDLLYCKCIATGDTLDPDLTYRWQLLDRLLILQERHPSGPLQFPYETVAHDATICTGPTTAASAATAAPATAATRMIRNAFRMLRQDGILYLSDKDNDTYVLVSRSRVLEPFVRQTLTKFASQRPKFLEHVPSARLQIVRRSVLKMTKTKRRNKGRSTALVQDGYKHRAPQTCCASQHRHVKHYH